MSLISARGARVLADWHGEDQRAYVERSHEARDHCWHAVHDLEANQFFVSLISRSRDLRRQGLLIWNGEEQVREERRQRAREIKQGGCSHQATGRSARSCAETLRVRRVRLGDFQQATRRTHRAEAPA